MRNDEFHIQVAVVRWFSFQYPKVLFTASAGGLHTSKAQAGKMKAAGYIAGCPDLIFFEARNGYNGLLVELKAENGRLADSQSIFLKRAQEAGYCTRVAYGFNQAVEFIDNYMKGV